MASMSREEEGSVVKVEVESGSEDQYADNDDDGGLGTDCDSDVIDVSDDESDDVGDAGVDSARVDKLDWAEISWDCRIQMNDFAPRVTPPGVNHNLDPDDSPLDYSSTIPFVLTHSFVLDSSVLFLES